MFSLQSILCRRFNPANALLVQCGLSKNFSNHPAVMLEHLNVQRYYSAFCDVSVRVEDMEFRLHKCVLAAASPKLQTLLCGLREDSGNVLTIKEVSLTGFRCLVEFIYSGVLKLDMMCVQDALNTSQYLELSIVEKACLDYLKSLSSSTMGLGGDNKAYRGVPDMDTHPCYPPLPHPPPPVMSYPLPPPPPPPPPLDIVPQEPPDQNPLSTQTEPTEVVNSQPMNLNNPPPPPPQLPPSMLPLPPPPPPMSFSNAGSTMDTNYIEDYLKLIESMQGDQVPSVAAPQSSHSHHMLPPSHDMHAPTYLQQSMSYGAPAPSNTQYSHLKEPPKAPPLSLAPPMDVMTANSQPQPLPSFSQASRPYRYYNTAPSTSNQYSAEDVRKTILNVLSQEKFDEDEDETNEGEKKTSMSLTSLLNIAPIHKKPFTADHFEDISEIEEMSTNGEDVDIEVDDDSSLPDTSAQPNFFDMEKPPSVSVSSAPEEEITVDDIDVVLPPETPDIEVEATDDEEDEEAEEPVSPLASPPESPVPTDPQANKQKRKKKTPVKVSKDAVDAAADTSTAEVAVTPAAPATVSIPTAPAATAATATLQSVIIITNPTVAVSSVQKDSGMFAKPLKKRMNMRQKKQVFVCKKCGRDFMKAETLERHQKSHSDSAMHSCHICGQMFPRLGELTSHLRVHSSTVYKCWLCEGQFNKPNMFKQHMTAVHNEKKPFICAVNGCNYRSHKLSNVERHSTIHSDRKAFLCLQCGKCFAQSNGLRSHLHSCTQQRGYLCDVCGAKFNYLGALKSHRLLHTGKKPYSCDDCGASFTDVRNFKRHRRIHDNVFPYPCTLCGKRYRHSNSLKKHMETQHALGEDGKLHVKPEKPAAKTPKKRAKKSEKKAASVPGSSEPLTAAVHAPVASDAITQSNPVIVPTVS